MVLTPLAQIVQTSLSRFLRGANHSTLKTSVIALLSITLYIAWHFWENTAFIFQQLRADCKNFFDDLANFFLLVIFLNMHGNAKKRVVRSFLLRQET